PPGLHTLSLHDALPISLPLLALVGVFGLTVGSFLNVCIHRLPRGQSLSTPRSRCPACERPLRVWHNIPLVSWMLLGGRCAYCRRSEEHTSELQSRENLV